MKLVDLDVGRRTCGRVFTANQLYKAILAHELGHVLSLLHPIDEKEPEHRQPKRNLLEHGGISYTDSYQTDNKRFMLFQEERMHSSQFVKNPQNQ